MRKAWIDPRGWQGYLRWASANQPEIVHAHLPHASWFARLVRIVAPVRVCLDTLHTSRTGGFGRRLGYRLTSRLSDHVTCVSQAVADSALAAGMIERRRFSVLPNGIEMVDTPVHRTERAMTEFIWLAIGRLAPVKDFPTLLRAFARLPDPARLRIAGSGAEEQALRELTATLGIDDQVEFLGFQSDVQPWLRQADGFVLSSLWEGLPMTVLEASACGVPVVATDVPGTREAVLDGETGYLAPPSDPDALAAAMLKTMLLPVNERINLGERGREWARERFALESVLDRWESLYGELMAKNPVRRRWRA
jgi:glycosyltransferase involved in cell wall biosynthesis